MHLAGFSSAVLQPLMTLRGMLWALIRGQEYLRPAVAMLAAPGSQMTSQTLVE
jgi:hypothetical protein